MSVLDKIREACFQYRATFGKHPSEVRVHPETYARLLDKCHPFQAEMDLKTGEMRIMGLILIKDADALELK